MKILMTSDTYLPSIGGGEYHVYYLAREIKGMGHEVTLFTTQKGECDDDKEMDVHRMQYKGIKSVFPLFKAIWKLSKNVDLIHAHYSYRLSFIAASVAFLRFKPFVVTQHGLGLLPEAGAKFPYTLAFKLWRWWSMKKAKKVISTSDDLSVDIKKLGFGKKIIHIPNGYDSERFKQMGFIRNEDPVLLTTRRLVPKTGIQYLIAALPALKVKHPKLKFISIGDGRLKGDLEELAEELGVSSMVEFKGSVPHEKILDYQKRADIVVFPSTAESTSLACIESMALGKIIVASRVGGLIELLGAHEERGYLVPITDSEHCNYEAPMEIEPKKIARLSDAILNALEDREKAESKAKKAAEYARANYAWSEVAKRTEEVYKSL